MPYADPNKQREFQRKWMAQRRADWFAEHPCVQCGATEDLQLDHIDRTLKVDHKIWSWSQARRDEELAKCQSLCRPCHNTKTIEDVYGQREHGQERMYKRGKCRCQLCRDEVARLRREQRARRNTVDTH